MFTVEEMRVSNAFIQMMRDKKVTLELDLETEDTNYIELGIVFIFDDPNGPEEYKVVTKYDHHQAKVIRDTLTDWLSDNTK